MAVYQPPPGQSSTTRELGATPKNSSVSRGWRWTSRARCASVRCEPARAASIEPCSTGVAGGVVGPAGAPPPQAARRVISKNGCDPRESMARGLRLGDRPVNRLIRQAVDLAELGKEEGPEARDHDRS